MKALSKAASLGANGVLLQNIGSETGGGIGTGIGSSTGSGIFVGTGILRISENKTGRGLAIYVPPELQQ